MTSTILIIGAMSKEHPLESVPAELNHINQRFKKSHLNLPTEYQPHLTREILGETLRSVTNNVAILHFAGHSSADQLVMNDEIIYSKHIAGIIRTWTTPPSLVFLNGCDSAGQVKELHEAGVKNVIATRKAIGDEDASRFANEFYEDLLNQPDTTTIRQAFDRASITTFFDKPSSPRSIDLEDLTEDNNEWDWSLYPANDKSDRLCLSDILWRGLLPTTSTRQARNIKAQAGTIYSSTATENEPQQYDIFISYRSTRRSWVEILAYNLQQQGYKVYLDVWELKAGDHFVREIYSALKHSKCALLIATPEAAESGWVQDEYESMLDLATKNKDFFWIPIVFGEFPDLPFLSTIQALDFADSTEQNYRGAFQKLLHGLERKPPGFEPYFSGNLRLPEIEAPLNLQTVINQNRNFTDSVLNELEASTPLMILAQADTNTQHYSFALKQALLSHYPQASFIQLFPPASTKADSVAYYGRLAKQCGFEETVSNSWEWADALRERLDQQEEIVLFITGFENGSEEMRGELAGELRGLLSNYPFSLKLIIMGGGRLAAAKYEQGVHSFFNDLEEMRLPDVSLQDLEDIYLQRFTDLAPSEETLNSLLTFTGRHPRLLEGALQCLNRGDQDWQISIKNSALPSQLFTRFREKSDTHTLCGLLNNGALGRYDAWPQDVLIRRLYWQNLITDCDGQFVWRCDFVCQTGKEILEC